MKAKKVKRFCEFAGTFVICILLCTVITYEYIQNKSQLEYSQMEQLVTTRANKVNYVITNLLYKTEVLSALVIQNNGEIEEFEKVVTTIMDDPAIRNVVVAPEGIVSHVYPLEGNEALIGFDFFSDKAGNREAILAKETGRLVLGGPFQLIQGGEALVGRLPVYLKTENGEKRFWGLVSITLNYPQALDGAELDLLKNQGFAYEIWRINPDTQDKQIIANSNYQYNKNAKYVEQSMNILNAQWYFRLSPLKNWYQYPETWIFLLTGTIISILIASLIRHNYDLKQMKAELEDLTYNDALTGILNRRGLFKEIEQLITFRNNKFIICFIDLNKFKMINDTYGHNTGDRILQEFVNSFKSLTGSNHIFARIGGDEFILIFKNTEKREKAEIILKKGLEQLKKADILQKDCPIEISFSVGMAVYPSDGKDIDELVKKADNEMYREKIKGKELEK